MSKEKQIKEMARLILKHIHCSFKIIAEVLYNAGFRKQSEWISVEERLPETLKCVLIYSPEGGVAEGHYNPAQRWVQFRWGAKSVKVTHWMPLPEPPKGDQHENV